jgi:hypothetical protein
MPSAFFANSSPSQTAPDGRLSQQASKKQLLPTEKIVRRKEKS